MPNVARIGMGKRKQIIARLCKGKWNGVGIIRDITRRLKTEEELKKSKEILQIKEKRKLEEKLKEKQDKENTSHNETKRVN
jgi:hypothetical protein